MRMNDKERKETFALRFGVCLGPEHAPLAARTGFDYLELSVAGDLKPEEDVDIGPLRSLALPVEALNGFLPGTLKLGIADVDWARVDRYLVTAIDRAVAVGAQAIVFGSGGARMVPEGGSHETAYANLVKFLGMCGNHASGKPLAIAIEPLNTRECNIITSVAEGTRLARDVNHPKIGVLSDLYHVDVEGQSFGETTAAGADLLHVHVAGAGRRAPNTEDIDFLRRYFDAVKAAGYDGRVSVECRWENVEKELPEALEALRAGWG